MVPCNFLSNHRNLDRALKYVGILLVLFSLVKCGVAIASSLFLKSNSYGLWWVPIPTFIVALLSLKSSNKLLNRIGFFFGSVIWILVFASILIDGFHATLIDDLDGCYAPTTQQSWGTNKGAAKAMNCSLSQEADFTYSNGAVSQCVCNSVQGRCYGYDLASGTNCGTIFTVYHNELIASCAFSTVLCVLVSVYIVFSGKKVRLREDEVMNSVPIPTIELSPGQAAAGAVATTPYMVVEAVTSDDIELQQGEVETAQGGYSLVRTGIRVQAQPLE